MTATYCVSVNIGAGSAPVARRQRSCLHRRAQRDAAMNTPPADLLAMLTSYFSARSGRRGRLLYSRRLVRHHDISSLQDDGVALQDK